MVRCGVESSTFAGLNGASNHHSAAGLSASSSCAQVSTTSTTVGSSSDLANSRYRAALARISRAIGARGRGSRNVVARDLSATLGKLNQFDDPEVRGQIDRAAKAILGSGKLLGSTAASGKVAKDMAARGYRFIIPGSDATLLGLGVRTTLADARP